VDVAKSTTLQLKVEEDPEEFPVQRITERASFEKTTSSSSSGWRRITIARRPSVHASSSCSST
jgi:hypothetical protein